MGPGKVDPHQKPAAAPGSLGGSIRVSADLGRRRAAGRADPRLRGSAALTLSKYLRPETALPASIGLIVREAQWRILPNVLRRRTSADSAGRSSRFCFWRFRYPTSRSQRAAPTAFPSGPIRSSTVRLDRQPSGDRMSPHRRQFLRGRWTADAAASAPVNDTAGIASVLVQARPEYLAAVQAAIQGIAGAEIAECDAYGKLVVVVDSSGRQSIREILREILLTPHVVSATLVSPGVDAS